MSWRDEEFSEDGDKRSRKQQNNHNNNHNNSTTSNSTNNNEESQQNHSPILSTHKHLFTDVRAHEIPVLAPLRSPSSNQPHENGATIVPPPAKKKRGRPPLDGEFDSYSTPKIAHVECAPIPYHHINHIHHPDSSSLVSVLLDESSQPPQTSDHVVDEDDDIDAEGSLNRTNNSNQTWDEQNLEMQMDCGDDLNSPRLIPKLERPDTPNDYILPGDDDDDDPASPSDSSALASVCISLVFKLLSI